LQFLQAYGERSFQTRHRRELLDLVLETGLQECVLVLIDSQLLESPFGPSPLERAPSIEQI